jgi:hypothetical protein
MPEEDKTIYLRVTFAYEEYDPASRRYYGYITEELAEAARRGELNGRVLEFCVVPSAEFIAANAGDDFPTITEEGWHGKRT